MLSIRPLETDDAMDAYFIWATEAIEARPELQAEIEQDTPDGWETEAVWEDAILGLEAILHTRGFLPWEYSLRRGVTGEWEVGEDE